MAKVVWSKRAVNDLRVIYDYIAVDSPFYAERVIDKLILAVSNLQEHTLMGRVVPERADPSIREIIEGNYRIFYKIKSNVVFILRVHHSARAIK